MTADREQEVRRLLRAMPDWAVPIWTRAGVRLVNGVSIAKVWELVKEEFAVAQAAHQNDVKVT